MVSLISLLLGQMSRRYTSLPSRSLPRGSVVRPMSTVPAIAYATTSGGEAGEVILSSGGLGPSKLRLPERTDATAGSFSATRSDTTLSRGPGLPVEVVQP